MSLYLPEEMRWLGWIAGAEWPDGDEDKAWEVSGVWKEAAGELLALLAAIDEAKVATMAAYPAGAAREEIGAQYDALRSGESSLEALGNSMLGTADATFDIGTELQAQKLTIIITLCWLAIEIALAWLFPPTAPAVEAAAVGTTRATLQAVTTATQRAISALASKLGAPTVKRGFWKSLLAGKPVAPTAKGWGQFGQEVLQGAAEEGLINGAIQAGQIAAGKRDEFNWEEWGYGVGAGGFAEPIGSAVAKGMNKGFGNVFGGGFGTIWGRAGQNTVVGATSDGVAGIFGSLFVSAISGQSLEDTLTGIGVAGGFIQGGIVGAADPSTFGFGPMGHGGGWTGGGGDVFGRSGPAFTDSQGGDGSVPGEQIPDAPGQGEKAPGDGFRSGPETAERGNESGREDPGGPRTVPTADLTPKQPHGSATWPQSPSGEQQQPPANVFTGNGGGFGSMESKQGGDLGGSSENGETVGESSEGGGKVGGSSGGVSGFGESSEGGGEFEGSSGGVSGSGESSESGGRIGEASEGDGRVGGSSEHGDKVGEPEGDRGGTESNRQDDISGDQRVSEDGGREGLTGDRSSEHIEAAASDDRGEQRNDPARSETHEDGQRSDQHNVQTEDPLTDRSDTESGVTDRRFGDDPVTGSPQPAGAPSPPATPVAGSTQTGPPPPPGQSTTSTPSTGQPQPGRSDAPAAQSSSAAQRATPPVSSTPAEPLGGTSGPESNTSPARTDPPPEIDPETGQPRYPTEIGATESTERQDDFDWAGLAGPEYAGAWDSWDGTPSWLADTQISANFAPPALPLVDPGMPAPSSGTTNPVSPVPAPQPPPAANQTAQQQNTPDRAQSSPAQHQSSPAQSQSSPAPRTPPANQGGQQPSTEVEEGAGRPKRPHPGTESTPEPEPPSKKARSEGSPTGPHRAAAQQPVPPVPIPVTAGPQDPPPIRQPGPQSQPETAPQTQPADPAAPQSTTPDPPVRRRPEPPMLLTNPSKTRVFGPELLAPVDNPESQRALEDALRGDDGAFIRYADPRTHPAGGTPYGELINIRGPGALGRGNNCLDCAISALATFLGRPEVAAPRYPDIVDGVVDTVGNEKKALNRVFHMLRTYPDSYRDGSRSIPEQFTAMHEWIAHLGEGSAAFVNNEWPVIDPATGAPVLENGKPKTYAHATVIVYPRGATGPVWWDPQSGGMSDGPPPDMVASTAKVDFIPIPPGRVVLDANTTPAPPVPVPPPAPPPGPVVQPVHTRPDPPARLTDPAQSRTFGPGHLDPVEHPGLQKVLEDALTDGSGGFVAGADPRTFPTPGDPYARMINAGGPALPGRASNKIDAALSALSSFLGNPQVAAPRHPDLGPNGFDGKDEQSGHVRAAQWLQSTPNYFDRSQPVAQQYTHLHNWIHHLGQGSAALVFSVVPQRDPGTGAILRDPQNRPVTIMQPTVIVYPPSASGPVWWNPVSGETWDGPPENLVRATAGFGFIPIPPGRSVDTSPAAPVPPPAAAGPTPPGPAGAPGDRREAGNTRFEPLADPSGAPLQLRQRLRRLLHETTRSAPAPTMGPVELVPRPDLSLRTAPPPERVGTTDPGSDEQNAPPVPPEPEQQHGARQDAESPESDIALGAPPDGTDPDVRMTDPAASPTGDPEPGTSGTAGTKRPLPEPQPVAGPAKRPQLEEATQPAPPVVPAAGPVPPPPEPPAPQIPDSQQTVMPKPVYDRPWPGPQLVNGNDTRMYGPGWLAPLEDPALQQQFEDAMRDDDGNFVKYADPRTFPSPDNPYGSRINAGGTTAPGRSKNCCDCSVSGLMSFLGLPQVALPRYHQIVNGVVDTGGSDGIDQTRLYQMLGNRPNSFNDGYRSINQQFLAIHDYVKNLGEGAAAYVSFHWQPRDPRTGRPMVRNGRPVLSGHATLVVHPVGAAGPVWWDPQGGIMSDRPTARLTYSTVRVDFIPIPPGRSVLPSLADRRASAPAAPPAPVRDPVREPVIAPVHHRPEPPAVLDNPADSRRFEPGGLREVEHPGFQKALEDALRDADGRYLIAADPRTHPRSEHPYGTMINPGGTALGGRGTNRFDAALSALSTFLGKPEVAARREPDPAVAGNDRADEAGGRDRAIRWLGSEPTGFDETLPMGRQYDALHNWVAQLGPGSAALVLPAKPGLDPQTGLPRPAPDGRVALDDPEPLVVVYPPSSAGPVWWNPVTGETWDAPPPSLVDTTAKLEFFPIPPGRTIAGAAPTAPASPRQVSQPVADRGLPPGPSDTARGDPESDPPARSSPNPHDPAGTPFHLRERFRRWTQRLPAEPPQVQPVAHAAEPVPPVTRPAPDPDPPGPGPASERRDPGSPAVSPAPSRVPTPPPPAPPPPRHGHPPPPRQVVHPDKSRVYGPGQLAPLEGPGPQRALEQAMRDKDGHFVRYSDPRVHPVGGRPYGELVNAAGLSAPGRETNCVDCALAALATFFGRPMVAAPAFFRVANSVIGPSGPEAGGADRITHTFRTGFDSYDYDGRSVPEQFDAITKWVAHLGPGSAAVVTNRWQAVDPRTGDPLINPDGSPKTAGAHALVVVYPVGAAGPVWWDPQSGDMSVRPPENMDQRSASVEFLPIPPGRTVIAEPPDGSPPLPPPATVSRPLPAIGPRRRRPAAMLLADPAESRRFERGYLDELEHPGYRTALEDALRDRDGNFVVAADPRTYPTTALPYGKLVNGGGPISPQRSYNKIDAALSGLSSFLGTPRVAVPRYPDPGLGRGYRDDEHGGLHRLQFWGRTNLSRFGSEIGPEAAHFPALHDWVDGLGPGSAAVAVIGIGTRDPYSGSLVSSFSDETEILLVVYPAGAPGPVWWNPVTGQTWDAPPAREFPDAVDFRFLEVPPGRRVDGKSGVQANVGPLVGPSVSQPEPPRRLAPPAADRDQHFGPVDPVAQQALENALGDGRGGFVTAADPRSFPTPASPYRTLVNPADPASPGFGLNTFDAALSALSSFFGAPQVAAPRPPQAGPDDEDAGAGDGIDRLLRWAKTDLDDFPARSMAEQFAALHDWVKHLGPGAAAVAVGVTVQVDQNTGTFDRTLPDDQLVVMGAAAPVVVFPRGAAEPVWWDPVTGAVWDSPPLSLIQRTAYLNFVAFPPGRSIDTAQANTGAAQNPAGDPLATEIEEGVIDESAATDRGTGTQSPPGGTSGRPSVLHRPDADRRLAPPAGDHRRGRGNRSRDRDVVPGRGVGYRGDPAVSELVGSDGDGGLHGGGDRRPGTGGTADLSAPDPDRIAADRREPGGGRIPGQRDIGTETGGTVLDGDSEGHAVAQPDEQRRDGRRGVGELAAGAGRNLAGDGDHRVLTDGPDPVAAPDSPGRSPGVRGHGRPQRRRPIEWSLPTGFRAPDAAGVSWLPPGAVPGDGPRPDTDAPDIPPTADGPAADPDRPEVDVPFTLNDSDPGTA